MYICVILYIQYIYIYIYAYAYNHILHSQALFEDLAAGQRSGSLPSTLAPQEVLVIQ